MAKIDSGVMTGNLLTPIQAIYPQIAKSKKIQGKVELKATIGLDGHIHSLRIVKADDASLALSALVAAKKAVYKPYYLNGEPVEVQTTIEVQYQIDP